MEATNSSILFDFSVIAYLVGATVHMVLLVSDKERLKKIAWWIILFGFVTHTAGLFAIVRKMLGSSPFVVFRSHTYCRFPGISERWANGRRAMRSLR